MCPFSFQINVGPLSPKQQNKQKLIDTIEALGEETNKFYALVDDDGDADSESRKYLRNLFYLDRYAKENYVLDPINVYFYLKRTTDKMSQEPKKKKKTNRISRTNRSLN